MERGPWQADRTRGLSGQARNFVKAAATMEWPPYRQGVPRSVPQVIAAVAWARAGLENLTGISSFDLCETGREISSTIIVQNL